MAAWLGAGLRLNAQAQARIAALSGTLTVRRSGRLLPAGANEPVLPGDVVATGADSEATILYPDGSTVRVFPDSRVEIRDTSGGIGEFLHLWLGSLKAHIEKFTGRPNPHTITTPSAVIAVRGTTFSVFVDEDDTTLVAVDEGVVSVRGAGQRGEVVLRGGQRTRVVKGQPPAAAGRFRGNSENAQVQMSKSHGGGPQGNGVAGANANKRGQAARDPMGHTPNAYGRMKD